MLHMLRIVSMVVRGRGYTKALATRVAGKEPAHARSSPRHLATSLIAACVVSGGHPRPIRDTCSSCLLVVWHGPKLEVE